MSKPEQCDVCGTKAYVLRLTQGDKQGKVEMTRFKIAAVNRHLYACPECWDRVEAAIIVKDWTMLPDGPLKRAFQQAAAQRDRGKEGNNNGRSEPRCQ